MLAQTEIRKQLFQKKKALTGGSNFFYPSHFPCAIWTNSGKVAIRERKYVDVEKMAVARPRVDMWAEAPYACPIFRGEKGKMG